MKTQQPPVAETQQSSRNGLFFNGKDSHGGFFAPVVQPKLTVNEPGDEYEQEADRVADSVMRMPDFSLAGEAGGRHKPIEVAETFLQRKPIPITPIQRKCTDCAKDDDDEKVVQSKESSGSDAGGKAAPSIVSEVLSSGGGHSMDGSTRQFMESRFGQDFSSVRIHTGSRAAESAGAIQARAYTSGRDVVFGAGEYQPESESGKMLLAHELVHVGQQGGGGDLIQRAEVEDRNSVCARLTDIHTDVNTFVRRIITSARRSPGVSPLGPFINSILSQTGGAGAVGPIETFIENLPRSKRFLPNAALSGTRFSSLPSASGLGIPSIGGYNIYHLHSSGLAHVVGATAKINGFCVGADKLGHFFQQGAQYIALASRPRSSISDAESFGRATEIDLAGLGATGVYSMADLAANLSGFQFWRDLVSNPSRYVFDINNYITSSWNEYSNPNFYENSIAQRIWATQLTGRWTGGIGLGPAMETIQADLVANTHLTGGTLTGTLTQPGTTPAVTGAFIGTITFNTTSVSGTIPSTVLHGTAGTHSARPVSGITVQFTWTLGTNSGRGTLNSVNELTLNGFFGNGTSQTNGGAFMLAKN